MKSNRLLKSMLIGSALALTAVQASAGMTLRYAEGSPNRGARADAVQYFADQVAQKSGGDLKLDIHWAGALVKYSALLEGVSSGTADMGSVLAAYQPQKLKALAIGDMPVGVADPWVGMRALYELITTNEQMQQSFAENDVVYLGNFTTTATQLECTGDTRIRTVDDLAGKRMRASSPYANILDEFGSTLVNVVYSEVYQALDTGLADCSASYLYAMRAFKTPEVTSSVTLTDWGQIMGFAMVMNKWTWQDLKPEQREVLRAAGSDMIDHFAREMIAESNDVLAKLPTGELGNKIEVIRMAPEEREKLLAKSDKYVQEWKEVMTAAGFDGEGIWRQYRSLLDKYQKEVDDRGYPWERS